MIDIAFFHFRELIFEELKKTHKLEPKTRYYDITFSEDKLVKKQYCGINFIYKHFFLTLYAYDINIVWKKNHI